MFSREQHLYFFTLSFGFAAGSDRSLQAFLERYVEMVGYNKLSYSLFHEWFEPGFVALLREILDDAIKNLDTGRKDLNGHLERFQDVLIIDSTIVSLYQVVVDVYAATNGDQAALKLHLTESLSTGFPMRYQTTDGRTHDWSQLSIGEWAADALALRMDGT